MIQIKEMTEQEYENSVKIPNSELCFYSNEKDIIEIVSIHLAEKIEETIEILKLFQPFNKPEVYEITQNEKTLYLIYIEKHPLIPIQLNQNLV